MATASQVSRVLGKKFTRSVETKSGMVRGWSNFSKGFSVTAGFYKGDPVMVDFVQGDGARYLSTEERKRREDVAFAEYTEYLTSQGFTVVEAKRGTARRVLEVTK